MTLMQLHHCLNPALVGYQYRITASQHQLYIDNLSTTWQSCYHTVLCKTI